VSFEDVVESVTPSSIKKAGLGLKFSKKIASIHSFYKEMINAGVPQEDARYILPNATTTKIIVTMNARELLHFFALRCCERAQWEIKEMATRMVSLAKEKAPTIFKNAGPGCVKGPCPEGEMTCGKPKEIRAKFKRI
jgi:thymidylate synthase (FAD)